MSGSSTRFWNVTIWIWNIMGRCKVRGQGGIKARASFICFKPLEHSFSQSKPCWKPVWLMNLLPPSGLSELIFFISLFIRGHLKLYTPRLLQRPLLPWLRSFSLWSQPHLQWTTENRKESASNSKLLLLPHPTPVSAGVCDILTYVRGLRLVLGVHQRAPVHKSQQVPEPHSLGVHHVQQSPPKLLPAGGAPHQYILQVLVWASGMVARCALCLHGSGLCPSLTRLPSQTADLWAQVALWVAGRDSWDAPGELPGTQEAATGEPELQEEEIRRPDPSPSTDIFCTFPESFRYLLMRLFTFGCQKLQKQSHNFFPLN